VFAVYKDKTQTGCFFKRLDKYKDKLVEAMDHEKEFFLINGSRCTAYRDISSKKYFGKTKSEIYKLVRKEISVRVDIIVLGSDESIVKTLESIKKSKHAPHTVWVVYTQKNVREFIGILNEHGEGIEWKLFKPLLDNADYKVIDSIVEKTEAHFYCAIRSGKELPSELLKKLDQAITDNLEKFVVVKEQDGVGPIVQVGFVKNVVYGNNEEQTDTGEKLVGAVEKAEWLAKRSDSPHLVKESL
jgi:hypothetical protein